MANTINKEFMDIVDNRAKIEVVIGDRVFPITGYNDEHIFYDHGNQPLDCDYEHIDGLLVNNCFYENIGGVTSVNTEHGYNAVDDQIRTFDTGADRDTAKDKLEYAGFLSPEVIDSYCKYMHKNRTRSDGTRRDSDNRKQGIPQDVYMQSMFRHFMDVWHLHEGDDDTRERFDGEIVGMEEALNGLLFNVMGYLYEHIKQQ